MPANHDERTECWLYVFSWTAWVTDCVVAMHTKPWYKNWETVCVVCVLVKSMSECSRMRLSWEPQSWRYRSSSALHKSCGEAPHSCHVVEPKLDFDKILIGRIAKFSCWAQSTTQWSERQVDSEQNLQITLWCNTEVRHMMVAYHNQSVSLKTSLSILFGFFLLLFALQHIAYMLCFHPCTVDDQTQTSTQNKQCWQTNCSSYMQAS